MASFAELKMYADTFLTVRSPTVLPTLLAACVADTDLLADPPYKVFYITKKNGSQRLIEDPHEPLKTALRNLNRHLQAVWYFHRSEAAYGFSVTCDEDPPERHRNIVNNARQHLGARWMLNVDLKDFFHHIRSNRVAWIFLSKPFNFDRDTAHLLMQLCTREGRLPMGSPSSPVLSNFAARILDLDLTLLARSNDWRYTRYADDMSFSSYKREITTDDFKLICDYLDAFEFPVNFEKVRFMGPKDQKVVTGIVVGEDCLDLTGEFADSLEREIERISEVALAQRRMGYRHSKWVQDYSQRIGGMLEFAGFVLGERHDLVQRNERAFRQALSPPESEFGAYSWMEFPYW